jgi:hypothetical protein
MKFGKIKILISPKSLIYKDFLIFPKSRLLENVSIFGDGKKRR